MANNNSPKDSRLIRLQEYSEDEHDEYGQEYEEDDNSRSAVVQVDKAEIDLEKSQPKFINNVNDNDSAKKNNVYRFKMREVEHDGILFRVLKIILVESQADVAAVAAKSTISTQVNYDKMLISNIDTSSIAHQDNALI